MPGEVEGLPREAIELAEGVRIVVDPPDGEQELGHAAAFEVLEVAAPSIRSQERQRLARQGGELPEAFGELDPESEVGVLIRAALTVAEEEERQRVRETLLLLAITHFDHERLLTDENLDATDLFETGLLQHHEIGQTGEYDAHLTAKGFERIRGFLDALPADSNDREETGR